MARVVKNTNKQLIGVDIITVLKSGDKLVKTVKPGDIVEGLRYVEKEEVKTISGRVITVSSVITKVTKVNKNNPVDYFNNDVAIRSITIDNSSEYHSSIVSVPVKEIVEDEGVSDVERMLIKAHPMYTMDIEYTDGTIANQVLDIGDTYENMVIMNTEPGLPDITGTFKLAAFDYKSKNANVQILGAYLRDVNNTKRVVNPPFDHYLEFTEVTSIVSDNPESLRDISVALENSESGVVYATLGTDVEIPKRDDGRITTTFINEGKTLNVDLAGHNLSCQAYAFYVNGGELNISDSTGNSKIECLHDGGNAYPAVFVGNGGTCNMSGGLIDTTNVDDSQNPNWLYGVVCSGNGVFNMTGGKMVIAGAAGISITNGTASGEGARFTIGGKSEITSTGCAGIYLADNKSVTIKDNAVINGGIVARMGDFIIEDNAVVNGHTDVELTDTLGSQVCTSGVDAPKAAFLALTGIYGSDLGNDMNVTVKDDAKLIGNIDNAIDIAQINTKFDQTVHVTVDKGSNLVGKTAKWKVYTHDELSDLAAAKGKTLAAETKSTTLEITIGDEIVYPVVNEEEPAEQEG